MYILIVYKGRCRLILWSQTKKMKELQRITTEYIAEQDRMRLMGEFEGSNIATLWLTRRIIKVLIPTLLEWLKKTAPSIANLSRTGETTDKSNCRSLPNYADEAIQGFAQATALSSLPHQTPVRSSTTALNYIVQIIDIETRDVSVKLVFKPALNESGFEPLHITMNEQVLRQWLNIIYDQLSHAEWKLDIWPEWIKTQRKEGIQIENFTMH